MRRLTHYENSNPIRGVDVSNVRLCRPCVKSFHDAATVGFFRFNIQFYIVAILQLQLGRVRKRPCFDIKQKLLEIVLKMTLLQSISAANLPSWSHNTGCFFKKSWRNLQQFCSKTSCFSRGSRTISIHEGGILSQTMIFFPYPDLVVFEPKPNQTISTTL